MTHSLAACPRPAATRVDVRGAPIWCGRRADAIDEIKCLIAQDRRAYVCCAPVHLVEVAKKDACVRRALLGAAMVLPDGAPVAWTASIFSRSPADRVCGSDAFDALVFDRNEHYRHFLYGGTWQVLNRLSVRLAQDAPSAHVVGTHAPPFRTPTSNELKRDAEIINAAAPDIVWVGLGAPKQELWMAEMRPLLDPPLLVGVGAVFDFAAGMKRRAPRYIQVAGLEWLHRLMSEPRRLASRYAQTNASFLAGVAAEALRRPGQRR